MVNENIVIEDTTQWLKREFDELEARITALKQQIESVERLEIFQRANKSHGLRLL